MIIFLRFIVGWLFTLLMSSAAGILAILGFPKQGWLWCSRPWALHALRIVGVRVDLAGAENLQGPAVFASNHQSLIDVVLLPALLPRTLKWIAKRELMRVPFWGWAFGATGAVMIDRTNAHQAISSIRHGIAGLPPNWSICIFPEGTRSKDGALRDFKKGVFHIALQTGLPIVPIGLTGGYDIVPPRAWLVRPGTMFVTCGKPIDTLHWTPDQVDARMEEVRVAVEACLRASEHRRSGHGGKPSRRPPSYELAGQITTAWEQATGEREERPLNKVHTSA